MGAKKNLQWTHDFLRYICKMIKNPKKNGAKNDTAPKLSGMIHYTIRNKFRMGGMKNLQWTHDLLHYICKLIKNPKN